ncbi:MAG: hypothetical protein KDJ43_07670 [Rhizobiaceae bacterium]|nr:hypothetical protein [Rhizobiaceae bacterium]MCC0043066.1 hypothetical protein [Brucellaceae bacterium]
MRKERDFASVLDQLMAEAAAARDDSAPSPAIQLDPLSVAEELCSGGIVFSTEELTARYADEMHNPDDNQTDPAKPRVNAPPLDPGMEALNTDRQSIARELGLDGRHPPRDLDGLRRRFAAHNHPDLVAPHLRADAMIRMQTANMLIDEAKKKRRGGFFARA